MHATAPSSESIGGNGSSNERLVIVVGDNGLTLRFIKNLTDRFSFRVIALIRPGPGAQRAEIRQAAETNWRLRVVERVEITAETISEAGLVEAYAVALMAQDDVGNLHLALKIREMGHYLGDLSLPHLVIRMYNRQLRSRIPGLLKVNDRKDDERRESTYVEPKLYVESDADMVAPTFAAAALQQVPPGDMDIWDRHLYLTRGPHERAEHQWVVAGDDGGDGAEMIPGAHEQSVRILCLAPARERRWFGQAAGMAGRVARQWVHTLRKTVQKGLVAASILLTCVMALGMWTLTHFNSTVNPVDDNWDALYILTLIAGGGIDPEMDSDAWVRITHSVVILSGSLLIPVVTGAIVQALVQRRFALADGRIVNSVRNHVIVVGLGNMGTRVVEHLRAQKIPVVAIEKDRDAGGIQAARAAGAQVLLGDASRPETLQEAEIKHSRSLVAMAKQDSANLEAALSGIECKEDLRTVMRIYDPEFARLVRRNLNDHHSHRGPAQHSSYSPSEVAAASFAAALTDDEILETIPVRGQIAYIGKVTVESGASLDGAHAGDATVLGSHQLLAVRRPTGGIRWNPDAAFRIEAGDTLLVLLTKSGLEELRQRCRAPGDERRDVVPSQWGG